MLLIELQYFRDGVKAAGVDGIGLEPAFVLRIFPADVPPDGVLPVQMRAAQTVQLLLLSIHPAVDLAVRQKAPRCLLAQEPVLTGGVQVRYQEEVFPFDLQPSASPFLDHLVFQRPQDVAAVGVLEQLRIEVQAFLEGVLALIIFCGAKHPEHGVSVGGDLEDAVIGPGRQLLQLLVSHVVQSLEHLVVELGVGDEALLLVALPSGAAVALEQLLVLIPALIVLPELELGLGEDDLDALGQNVVLLAVDVTDETVVNCAVPPVGLPDEFIEREGGQQPLDPGCSDHKVLPADRGEDHAAAVGMGDGHIHLPAVDLEVVRGDVVHEAVYVGLEILHHDTSVDVELLP